MKSQIASNPIPGGRDAITIHIFACVTAGLCVLMDAVFDRRPEFVALFGVASSSAAVLFFWSLFLAARSCYAGEPAQPAIILGCIVLLELLVFFCSLLKPEPDQLPGTLFEYADYYGVAFFVVFFIVMTFIAAPLAWRRVRRQITTDEAVPRYSEVYNRVGRQYGVLMFVLTVLLLPVTLFYYCAQTTCYITGGTQKSWRVLYIESSPDLFRDSFCDVLSVLNSNRNKSLHLKFLEHRWVSQQHLEKQLKRSPIFREAALSALISPCEPKSLPFAFVVAARGPTKLSNLAAQVIAKHASREQVRSLLNPNTPVLSGFRGLLMERLGSGTSESFAYTDELKSLVATDVNSRVAALYVLAQNLSNDDFMSLWTEYLSSADEHLRVQATWVVNRWKTDPFPVMLAALKKCDESGAASLLKNLRARDYFPDDSKVRDEWLAYVKTLSESPDSRLRVSAREWLQKRDSMIPEMTLEEMVVTPPDAPAE